MSAPQFSAGRPICILIAAMGGEGGGVLTGWLVGAAQREGFPVQSTSIPGVAQRTGATTYYIEIWPEKTEVRPVMCLNPMPGQVDVMVASEFVEAGRAIANGYVSPDRTLLIASTHRVYAVVEKSAMGDGRYDTGKLFRAARDHAKQTILFDMDQAAKDAGSILNAVLLGALAGAGVLPIPSEAFEAGIRAEGKAVDSNLAGYRFGLAHGKG
ncbi:2-oxoacid:acceptor oxidoreductase family protein, partial [Ferrovibrio sp.]|uniref:2-oxoacid:acceptor oxidoreductase family protein n=1 Tax=Ferrovibrio sp. TaxID=1917215 RepID=UPI00261C19E1